MEEHRTPEWTCSEVLHLIREYGKRPALWDPDCEDYKNRFRKHHKWMELAAIFKCSKLEVERKMKILNSQYRRERLKAVRMRKMGLTHRVTWYGYKAFDFMNKHWVRYKNRVNLMTAAEGEGVIKQEADDSEFEAATADLIPFLEEEIEQNNDLDGSYTNDAPDGFEDKQSEQFSEAVDENKQGHCRETNVKISLDKKDECLLFGELVAHALRKFDDRTRCIVKHKINTILYEAEIATYENSGAKSDFN